MSRLSSARLSFVLALFLALGASAASAQSFVRGDANIDGNVDISDATTILGCLFLGDSCPDGCLKVADTNDDGGVDIADPIQLLNFLFLGGQSPALPFPDCGDDPTRDELSCREYPHCDSTPDTEEGGEGDSTVELGGDDGEGETSTSEPPRESDPGIGRVELQLSGQLPRGVDEVVMQFESLEWVDSAGDAHTVDSLPSAGLGVDEPERLPAFDLEPGRYVALRITFAAIDLVSGEESRPLSIEAPVHVDFGRLRQVVVEADATTIVSLDLDFGGDLVRALLLASEISPVISVDVMQLAALERLVGRSDTPARFSFDEDTGSPRFLAGSWDVDPNVTTVELQSRSFLRANAALLAMNLDTDDVATTSTRRSQTMGASVRMQQTYSGIPVFGADLVVRLKDGQVRGFNGRFLSGIDLSINTRLSGSQAFLAAQDDLAGQFRGIEISLAEEPTLFVVRPSLRHASLRSSTHLAYQVVLQTLSPAGRWVVFVDAVSGEIVDQWNSAFALNNSRVFDAKNTQSAGDDDVWFDDCAQQQGGTPPGEVGALQNHQRAFFLFMQNRLQINSIDDGGKMMVARANDPAATGLQACWDCRADETVYLSNWVTADVVAHEFTHGIVEELAGGLGSSVQARTLNEASADIFAELQDCRNGSCNYLVGTDYLGNAVPGGWVRDFANPSIDHMSNYNWSTTSPYVNIGIPSKVAYLLREGDTHYGVSVSSIGQTKCEQLYIATLADGGLSSSATFEEYREVMIETADSLPGFTNSDRRQVYRAWVSVGLGALTQPVVGALNESSDYFGWTLATGNFNGDNYEDLAIGCPYEGYAGKSDTGVVFVFYGSSIGLKANGAEIIAQNHMGGSNGTGDRFGYSLAVGNFNGDNYDDLAIGVPYENANGRSNSGMVRIAYGASSGLKQGNGTSWEAFTQAYATAAVETNDRFGFSLAAGNFNGDNYDDLAVGTPYEHLGSTADVGIVHAFYGSNQGLIRSGGTMSWEGFTQSLVGAANEANDRFGFSLAAGNFNGGNYDDLAIGVPYEHVGSRSDSGVVNIVYGSNQGLIRSGPSMSWERVSQSTFDGANENGDLFGYSLAVGKFSNGSHDDLAIGTPRENFNGRTDVGVVTIVYGSNAGLYPPAGWHRLAQSHAGGANESNDRFSEVLTAGNLNGDGYDDLIVGVPLENAFGRVNNGVVSIFYGSSNGVYPSAWEWYGQSLTGGAEDDSDRYGFAVAAGDFDNDGEDDLAASAPWEDGPGGVANVGAVYVREY
jgi:Zn-dependent metalloprotease